MTREHEKEDYEKNIFVIFIKKSGLNLIEKSIKNGNPNLKEPDILCKYKNGKSVGFELGRLTDPILSAANNSWNPVNGEYIRTRDHSSEITNKKLKKEYMVNFPVELLLYKENPIITPDNVIIPTIKPICNKHNHAYKRIWFMGDSIELLHEKAANK